MSRRPALRRGRLLALVVVATLLALAGVANATMRSRPSIRGGPRSPASPAEAMALVAHPVSSSAWYCAGPLPVGAGKEASSIAVANLGDHTARGQLVVISTRGARRTAPIAIAAHAQAVYGLPRTWVPASAAATVLLDTASVGVEELVHGPSGPMAASCGETTGRSEYLAEGSTRGADNVSLSLYDPGATPAVVSVTFATSTGGASPPAFQGVDVSPGGLVVLDVGREVPSRLAVATIVRSTGGRVVVGARVDALVGHRLLGSLVSARSRDARHWALPAAPLGAAARQSFSVLDPTNQPAHVLLRLTGAASGGEISEVVPPGAVVDVAPAALAGLSSMGATLTSTGAPVVVARELAVSAPASPATKHVALLRLPGLPSGFSAANGTTAPFRRWLLVGGESDAHVSEVVTITNPGSVAATVHLGGLRTSLPAAAASLQVAPGASMTLSLAALPSLRGHVSLVVSSSEPVLAGELLYSAGQHPLGLAAVAGIPVR